MMREGAIHYRHGDRDLLNITGASWGNVAPESVAGVGATFVCCRMRSCAQGRFWIPKATLAIMRSATSPIADSTASVLAS